MRQAASNAGAALTRPMRENTRPADDIARALDALHAIPADLDRNAWVRVLMAAKAAGLSEAAARDWSATGANFCERDFRDVWRGLRTDGAIGPGTLFFMAKEHGWRPDPAAPRPPPPTAAEVARQRADREARDAAERAERQRRADKAALDARQRLAGADPVNSGHGYLARKGLALPPDVDIRQDGNALLVPVRRIADDVVRGVQIITADGAKRFSRGTQTAGCGWWTHRPAPLHGGMIFIAEGVATAVTVAIATGDPTLAAFSAGNLEAAALAVRERWPAAEIVIAADADEAGRAAAAKAAAASAARVVVPVFAPERGA